MVYSITYNEKKNQLLKQARNICFEDVVEALNDHKLVGNVKNKNNVKYPNQYMFLINIDNYIYVVPYIIDQKKRNIFLKTIYPSRKFTKMYRSKNGKKK